MPSPAGFTKSAVAPSTSATNRLVMSSLRSTAPTGARESAAPARGCAKDVVERKRIAAAEAKSMNFFKRGLLWVAGGLVDMAYIRTGLYQGYIVRQSQREDSVLRAEATESHSSLKSGALEKTPHYVHFPGPRCLYPFVRHRFHTTLRAGSCPPSSQTGYSCVWNREIWDNPK
jgi:hypothetical protein